MLVAGVDVGAATAKTATVRDGVLIAWDVMPTGDYVSTAALEVTNNALEKAGLKMSDLDYACSTGYGRRAVKFSSKAISEIICHAKGVNHAYPEVRTIIDIGGQDSKVISVRPNGSVADFVMNDKCAAGTGRFLEVMADVLKLTIDEMGPTAIMSTNPARINSTCTIMGRTIGYNERIAFTGGVAKNTGCIHFLEAELKTALIIPDPPQLMGALGAALLATIDVGTKDFSHDDATPSEDMVQSGY